MPWKDPEKRRAAQARYREQHREEARLRSRAWREANPERVKEQDRRRVRAPGANREYHKRWYEQNRDAKLAQNAEWFKAHPDMQREYTRKWRAENVELARASGRASAAKWRANNPDKARAYSRQDKARRRGAKTTEVIPPEEIYKREGYRCHICGKRVPRAELSLDHLLPIAHGGKHTRANVATAHKRCNSSRGAGRKPAQLLLIG